MFHTNLKNLRLSAGLSQKQVAEFLTITPQSVSKWEKGDALPSIEYLPALAECLGCDVNAFFAPSAEKAERLGAIMALLAMMHEEVYGSLRESKKVDAIADYEREHPSSIDAVSTFYRKLKRYKTVTPGRVQGILGCTEEQAREVTELLASGEELVLLDTRDTYYVNREAVQGMEVLFGFQKTLLEVDVKCDKQAFTDAFLQKVDEIKKS